MRTFEGKKDTANKIIEALNKQAEKEYMKNNKTSTIPIKVRDQIIK